MNGKWLFPIDLRGVGTEEIECLPSYLIRAGTALGIGPAQIVAHTVGKYLDACNSGDTKLPRIEPLTVYLRPNRSTEQLVKSLDLGTGIPGFSRSTFLAIGPAIDRCMGAFSKSLRWCHSCFEEFLNQGDKGYFKLIWQVNGVTHCHIHHVPLIDRCAHCNGLQSTWRYRRQPIDCAHCKKSLGSKRYGFDRNRAASNKSADILILVKEIGSDAELSFPPGGVRSLLSAIFDEFWDREEDLKMWKRIPRDTYLSIICGTRPVTLETARSLAFRLGMTIPQLLRGRLTHTTKSLDPAWTENIPKEFRPRRHRELHNVAQLEEGIKLALNAPENECKSLKEVASDLGVSDGCLRYRFPAACEQIIRRNQQKVQGDEIQIRMRVRAAVTGYLSSRPIGSESPHGVVTSIWRETGLPRERIRAAVDEFLKFGQPSGRAPAKSAKKHKIM